MKSKTNPLTADPHPIVLRSLWYIAPTDLRTKAVEAAARAEDFETFTDPAEEIERLTAELAARAPAARVTGVRVATGAREELNEFAEQAWRDGLDVEAFTDIREDCDNQRRRAEEEQVAVNEAAGLREVVEGCDELLAEIADMLPERASPEPREHREILADLKAELDRLRAIEAVRVDAIGSILAKHAAAVGAVGPMPARVVAASAREPHADVVLQALHVSGGAAANGVESPVPWCLKCNKPVTGFAQEIVAPVDAVRVRAISHGETFERTYTAAEIREHGMPPMMFFGPERIDPRLHCARCDKPVGMTAVREGEDVLCLPCSIDDLDGRDLDRSP